MRGLGRHWQQKKSLFWDHHERGFYRRRNSGGRITGCRLPASGLKLACVRRFLGTVAFQTRYRSPICNNEECAKKNMTQREREKVQAV